MKTAGGEAAGLPHPAPAGARIYLWHGGLLLLAESLYLDRPTAPIAATLRLALGAPYTIEVEDRVLTTQASLVGSKRLRKRVVAPHSEVMLFYFPIERPEHAALRRFVGKEPVLGLDMARFAPVLPRLRLAFDGKLTPAEVRRLADDTLRLVADPADVVDKIDPRIRKACELMATMPLNEFDLDALAEKLHLSPSRLRGLFREQIGHPIGEYARWSAIWQAAENWHSGRSFTEVALDAGFFDLAHADKTLVEVFGMSPSLATDPRFVQLIHCD